MQSVGDCCRGISFLITCQPQCCGTIRLNFSTILSLIRCRSSPPSTFQDDLMCCSCQPRFPSLSSNHFLLLALLMHLRGFNRLKKERFRAQWARTSLSRLQLHRPKLPCHRLCPRQTGRGSEINNDGSCKRGWVEHGNKRRRRFVTSCKG